MVLLSFLYFFAHLFRRESAKKVISFPVIIRINFRISNAIMVSNVSMKLLLWFYLYCQTLLLLLLASLIFNQKIFVNTDTNIILRDDKTNKDVKLTDLFHRSIALTRNKNGQPGKRPDDFPDRDVLLSGWPRCPGAGR
jgi:hypothetical protein